MMKTLTLKNEKKNKKKGLHFVHININSLLTEIDELWHLTKTTYASVVVSETKLNNSILSNEIQIEGYNILRLDRSQRGGGVAYVKKKISVQLQRLFL